MSNTLYDYIYMCVIVYDIYIYMRKIMNLIDFTGKDLGGGVL